MMQASPNRGSNQGGFNQVQMNHMQSMMGIKPAQKMQQQQQSLL